jgi:hypothetical protein
MGSVFHSGSVCGRLLELIQDMPDVSARSDRDRDAPLSRRFIE